MIYSINSIFIIGKPHGIGGISTHVKQWIEILLKNNFLIELFDFSGQIDNDNDLGSQGHVINWQGSRIKILIRLFARSIFNRPALVHVHMSKGAKLFYISPLLYILNKLRPCVYTIHGGLFPQWINEQSKLKRKLIQKVLTTSARIIAVNAAIKNTLISELGLPENKISVIPAYFPLNKPIEKNNHKTGGFKLNLMASGYPTNIYGWELLLEAVAGISTINELNLFFYNIIKNDVGYLENIINKAKNIGPCKIIIHKEIDHKKFLMAMGRSDIFIRPTLVDGDSIAVREALSYGLEVIASDSAERPDGCILFRLGDANDLRDKIIGCSTISQNLGRIELNTDKMLLALYSDVMG